MIEVPSAALLIDHILKYIDFVSIGTNDLTQYLLAADRTNEYVSMLADYCNPAVIQMINTVLIAGKKHNKEVSICGEMASDALVAPLLYGMGLSIYSVSAIRIPYIKMILSQLRQAECQQLAEKCLRAESASEVRSCLREFAETNIKE